ncbi:MAG: 16S rRNA (guanine(966)-N(2))-methyltransferase RsmD [Candidatus Omnitrophica bacterium]|nr:16S rRNA (guanine(966)-N(2))-methyltransferase RsmD [Candidatus Omnitrophota bacterium]MBU4148898.1 16S rRNA (guanine(966)-N(2))-methyltransferase RsmD [Candidatus Omnitrophota bacterium]
MKIISGKFKGRVIEMPRAIRPTSDKVREALFEILKGRIEGASFLDLYCGSGAMGIEALSRGAETVSFVDNSLKGVSILKKNLSILGLSDASYINIYKESVLAVLRDFEKSCLKFDIIFLDPPYHNDLAKNSLIEISNYDILTRNAIIVAEIYKKENLPEAIGLLRKTRTSRYGDTALEFFKNEKDSSISRKF